VFIPGKLDKEGLEVTLGDDTCACGLDGGNGVTVEYLSPNSWICTH
jgi:hypothetical protein